MTLDELEALDRPASAPQPAPKPVPPPGSGAFTLDQLEALDGPAAPSTAPTASGRGGGLTLDQLEALDSPATASSPPAAAPAQQPAATPEASHYDASKPWTSAERYDAAGRLGGAIVTGAAKSIFETKDFLFGETADSDKSGFRQGIETLDRSLGEASAANTFVSSLSQFAVGMLGAGKVVGVLKAAPVVGGALEAAEATRKGAWAISTAKAATVGAVAFDPHGARLSDLMVLHGPDFLQNPVTAYLASSPDDSAALGRMKNALESIGVDVALAGVFAASVKGYATAQAYRAGRANAEAVHAATAELDHAVTVKDAKLAASKGDTASLEALRETNPAAVTEAEVSLLPAAQAQAANRAAERQALEARLGALDAEAAADAAPPSTRERLEDAYLGLTGGQTATAVRLSALRNALPDLDRGAVDEGLKAILRGDPSFRLSQLTDPKALDAAEKAAAYSPAGEPFHLAWLQTKAERPDKAARSEARLTERTTIAERMAALDAEEAAAPAGARGVAAQPKLSSTADEVVSGAAEPTGVRPEADPAAAPRSPAIEVTDDQLARLIADTHADTDALLGPGGWDGAIARGYRFGDGGNIPWQKLAREEGHAPGRAPLDQVLRRVSDAFSADIARAKGGDAAGVRSDALQDQLVRQRVAVYNDDPAEFLGILQMAGRNADSLVADVGAADLLTLRAAQDAQNLAARIRLGALEEFGGDAAAATAALRDTIRVAATARAQSAAMVANAARTLRRQRTEFQFSLEDLKQLDRLPDAKLLTIIEAAGREPAVVDRLLRRGFWGRLVDDASYLYVNNLLWGLRTHFVNLSTNAYMLGARPLERMIGGALQGDRALVASNARQYAYMAGSLHEAWRSAVRTWKTGDSILAPHASEVTAASAGRSVNWVAEGYKPATSVPNILSNAYTGFMKAAGLPTRALGAVDELVKQTVYQSKVMAAAHGEGVAAGLDGAALSDHVRRTLNAAFDDAGRATDLKALDEAHIATFQQDLLPNTLGAWVQSGVGSIPALRFVLPFVRTPTNVLRMGWKLTPGANLLQKEYRAMIRGERGPEAQAQAMGQFAMGSLFLGVGAMLAGQGYLTGGGPRDPQLRKDLLATGWQPYSFVVPGEDGPTYVNFGRYDPVAMPLGIMADIVDVLERDQDGDGFGEQATAALGGVFLSLVKQMAQKSYLTSLNSTLEAVVDPGEGSKLLKVAGSTAANFVPAASGLRFVNPDPLMRETRGIVDSIMATVPGLSERLPPRRDLFGDPLTVHKGLWVYGEKGLVDAEVRRMVDSAAIGPFGAPHPVQRGLDLRDVTMKDGRNAYDAYQELAGHPPRGPSMKATLGKIMATSAYQRAPDGEPGDHATRGTKQAMLTGTVSKYREAGFRYLMADPNVRQAVHQQAMRGRAASAAVNAPKSDQAEGAAQLRKLGATVGVELGGMVPAR